MDKTPVYKYPASYARENDELSLYRASNKANIACKEAIEQAIADHYRDNRLTTGAVKQVVEQFGYERMFYVLANTVKQKDWDGRISDDNKAWASTITVFENPDAWGQDRNCYFVVDRPHTGLTDLFIKQARHEYLLTQPLNKQDIQTEAARLLSRLQAEREPNSPSGTHFMAQISPDFLMRAGSKDQDKLFSLLPFSSLTISTLNDRKGEFVFISNNENRDKQLRTQRQSVKDKLRTEGKTTGVKKAPSHKEVER